MNPTINLVDQLKQAAAQADQFEFCETYYETHPPVACKVALDPENKEKNLQNRWGYPYDHNLITTIPHYINASPMELNTHRYIAAQGPRKTTFAEFWKMVWIENASLIVSVTNEVELKPGWFSMKFERFWPLEGSMQYGDITVQIEGDQIVQEWKDGRQEKIRQRQFTLMHGCKTRHLTHLHMENWPDNGIIQPSSLTALSFHADKWKNTGPLVVHCAAGVGRTGTFIAFHSLYHDLMEQLQRNTEPTLDVVERVKTMRRLRWGAMVGHEKQYQLIIKALHEII